MEAKTCPRCKESLPIESFSVDNAKKSGRSSYCVPCNAARRRDWYAANADHARELAKEKRDTWVGATFEKPLSRNTAANRIIRDKVLDALGGKCACCGTELREFLTVDHIHGGGGRHRAENSNGYFYRLLLKDLDPSKYRILCYNCNCSRAHRGYCPHERM